jgi:hypothetical protein
MNKNRVTASLSAADTWTDWLTVPKNADSMVSRYGLGAREMFIMASNSFTGALTIQCRDDESGQIANAETFTAGQVVKNGYHGMSREIVCRSRQIFSCWLSFNRNTGRHRRCYF